jgi:hypothetical protein
MNKLKTILGIFWAFLGLLLILILFPGLSSFSREVSKFPFMKIHPRYAGGEASFQAITEGCTLVVHRPVFDGLLRERKNGFVQIDWRGEIGDRIADTIDYNQDGNPDFVLYIDTRSSDTSLDPISNDVRDVNISTSTSYGWAARINLSKR